MKTEKRKWTSNDCLVNCDLKILQERGVLDMNKSIMTRNKQLQNKLST